MRSSPRKINILPIIPIFVFPIALLMLFNDKNNVRDFFLLTSDISTRLLFSTRTDYSAYIADNSENKEASVTENTEKITYPDVNTNTRLHIKDSEILDIDSKDEISENVGDFEAGGEIIEEFYDEYYGEDYVNLSNGGQVRNLSELSNDEIIALGECDLPFEISGNGEPEVLIMHTHTTEAYELSENKYYNVNKSTRSLSESENMIAVGQAMANEIYKSGIGVIHDTTIHDYPDYNSAYDNSRKTVQTLLEKYPEIKVVLDIHRDAIERDSSRISAVTTIDAKKAAQIMIICGYKDNSHYKENFKFASSLQSEIESDYPTLTRPVLFDYRFYNQDLSTGSLLIEIGSHGNTLEEAVYSGELVGKALGKLLKGN